jgi:sulfur-oxidizing protein SoxX
VTARLPVGAVLLAAALAFDARAQGASMPAADLFVRADKGHCIACHQLPEGAGAVTRSDVGPKLEGARMRLLGKPKLRELLRDPLAANPDTLMPPFGRHRILDAAEIDRLVEYLNALP